MHQRTLDVRGLAVSGHTRAPRGPLVPGDLAVDVLGASPAQQSPVGHPGPSQAVDVAEHVGDRVLLAGEVERTVLGPALVAVALRVVALDPHAEAALHGHRPVPIVVARCARRPGCAGRGGGGGADPGGGGQQVRAVIGNSAVHRVLGRVAGEDLSDARLGLDGCAVRAGAQIGGGEHVEDRAVRVGELR